MSAHGFGLRVPAGLWAALEIAAKESRRSVHAEVLVRLERSFPDPVAAGLAGPPSSVAMGLAGPAERVPPSLSGQDFGPRGLPAAERPFRPDFKKGKGPG